MTSRRHSVVADERGFTLIEVLVAATLLIVSVFATLSILDNATKTTAVSKQQDVANGLAQEMIERASGGRYTTANNDLTDVNPASPQPGPADRMRAALDPDNDQSSTAVTPATTTSGSVPLLNIPQSWTLRRKGTTYTVSYRACTMSDAVQHVQIAGPFDCDRPSTDPTDNHEVATSGSCKLGVIPPSGVDPNPGQLTVKLQVLGITGFSVCVGAVSQPLSDALCTLLGSSNLLNGIKSSLVGSTGSLTTLLGGLLGTSVGLCDSTITEQAPVGAWDGIGTSTRLAVTVAWTDVNGHAHTINQAALIRRAST